MNYEGCHEKSAKRFNIHTAWGMDAMRRPYPRTMRLRPTPNRGSG